MPTLTMDTMLTEARDWIYDSLSDAPDEMTDMEVIRAVRRHYNGGWQQFTQDAGHDVAVAWLLTVRRYGIKTANRMFP